MTTSLRATVRRELTIGGKPYVLTITSVGFKLVPKGKRKGTELLWRDLVSGDAALAVALNASLAGGAGKPRPAPSRSARPNGRR